MRLALLPALILASCGHSTSAALPVDDPALSAALFLDARSIEPGLAKDFTCAGIEGAGTEEDPPTAVLALIRERLGVPVLPQSDCRRDERTSLVVGDRVTGSGTWLTIGDVGCVSPDRCRATVSYYVANQGAGGREVTAERTASGWRVHATGNSWIS